MRAHEVKRAAGEGVVQRAFAVARPHALRDSPRESRSDLSRCAASACGFSRGRGYSEHAGVTIMLHDNTFCHPERSESASGVAGSQQLPPAASAAGEVIQNARRRGTMRARASSLAFSPPMLINPAVATTDSESPAASDCSGRTCPRAVDPSIRATSPRP